MANVAPVSGEWATGFDVPTQEAAPAPAPPAPKPKKLNVVLPFLETDIPQVVRLLQWCRELSGQLSYSLFLLPFKGITFTDVHLAATKAFVDVQVIQDSEGMVSDWKEDAKIRDAAGPNSMFRQAAWYFYFHQTLGPWLYLEPDCVPLTKDWLQQLEADYQEGTKPISGIEMQIEDRLCLNGVAIYPANLIQIAPDIVTRVMWQQHPELEIAFDIAGGSKVLQKAHLTSKIQFSYRKEPTVDLISGNAVLFHGDRNGTLLALLRERGVEKLETHLPHKEKIAGSNPAPAKPFPATEERCPRADPTPASLVNLVQIPATSGECRADDGVAGNQSLGEAIRFHCDALLKLENAQYSRKNRIIAELRKRKLVPRARAHRK